MADNNSFVNETKKQNINGKTSDKQSGVTAGRTNEPGNKTSDKAVNTQANESKSNNQISSRPVNNGKGKNKSRKRRTAGVAQTIAMRQAALQAAAAKTSDVQKSENVKPDKKVTEAAKKPEEKKSEAVKQDKKVTAAVKKPEVKKTEAIKQDPKVTEAAKTPEEKKSEAKKLEVSEKEEKTPHTSQKPIVQKNKPGKPEKKVSEADKKPVEVKKEEKVSKEDKKPEPSKKTEQLEQSKQSEQIQVTEQSSLPESPAITISDATSNATSEAVNNATIIDDKNKNIKIVLISAAILISLVLSVVVGMELALMRSGRIVADAMGSVNGVDSDMATEDIASEISDESNVTNKTKATADKIADSKADNKQNKKNSSKKNQSKSGKDKKSDKGDDANKENKTDKVVLPDKEEMIRKKEEIENRNPNEEITPDKSGGEGFEEDVHEGVAESEAVNGSTEELLDEGELLDDTANVTDFSLEDYVDPNLNYPSQFTTVGEDYFTDALFIGDSRMQGFGLWSELPATFYCATGFQLYRYETAKVVQTEDGKVPIFDALPFNAFTKIYIKVGLNEMGWGNEGMFQEKYAELIAKLRQYEPRAIIYIHGLLPVTAAKSAEGGSHNNANIAARNAELAQFAISQNAYYLDAGSSVMDEQGCLGANMASDGVHLKAQYIALWKQYIMEHAIVIQ